MNKSDIIQVILFAIICGVFFIFFVTYGVLGLWAYPICTIILISGAGILLGIGIACIVSNPEPLGW